MRRNTEWYMFFVQYSQAAFRICSNAVIVIYVLGILTEGQRNSLKHHIIRSVEQGIPMQPNPKALEITGKAAKTFGNVLVPAAGKVNIKINNDLIQAVVKSGLEETETWVRAQNIDSVEIAEAPIYLLLGFGILMGLSALGNLMASEYADTLGSAILFGIISGVCIWLSIKHKRRFLIIHSTRSTIPVFMTKPAENYRQFATNVMLLARQLNARTPVQAPQTQSPQRNGQRPAVSAKQ